MKFFWGCASGCSRDQAAVKTCGAQRLAGRPWQPACARPARLSSPHTHALCVPLCPPSVFARLERQRKRERRRRREAKVKSRLRAAQLAQSEGIGEEGGGPEELFSLRAIKVRCALGVLRALGALHALRGVGLVQTVCLRAIKVRAMRASWGGWSCVGWVGCESCAC